ncbi:hypothetical protein BpHYR1_047930 [Brachionus plicatilis]|uniref:Uncharacterized protein n=1 Tax=Brachionus plicatilis TaxID=10195 RepID=A0A3M7RLD1_BRAPC|nr:hypothetical protein BpHYR1_047930 [Brachionus plicatilis]
MDTDNLSQMDRDVRNKTSEPNKKMQSQTRKRTFFGKQVANRVRNHCMVNTLVSGGSICHGVEL